MTQLSKKTKKYIRAFIEAVALLTLGAGSLSFVKTHFTTWDPRIVLYLLKLIAGAYSPILVVAGAVSAVAGLLTKSSLAVAAGSAGLLLSAQHALRVTAPHNGFAHAFGPDWGRTITHKVNPEHAASMLRRRWQWRPSRRLPQPRFEQDIAFWTIHGTDRRLLCDVWRPAAGISPSGLAVIYLHPGGWQSYDKDNFTRTFFRHLTAQGHVIMDVAYRMAQETDLFGIVGDVKRAIVWIKSNTAQLGVNSQRIVLMGGSAGGHLAMLAGYTPNDPRLDPPDVQGADTSVRAVISYYGLSDLRLLGLKPERSSPRLVTLAQRLGFASRAGYFDPPELARRLFGGLPNEATGVAALMSPVTHVGPHCPPTLHIQGAHDHITSLHDARELQARLVGAGVPSVYVELPQVDHAFDLAVPDVSPSAQSALYDVERFLALML